MFKKTVKKFFVWLISISLLTSSFISPFQTFATDPQLIVDEQPRHMGDTVNITVMDSNVVLNSIVVSLTSGADLMEMTLTETGEDSGVFSGDFIIAEETDSMAYPPQLKALFGDNITIAYGEDLTSNVKVLPGIFTEGEPFHSINEEISVVVKDTKLNLNSEQAETASVYVTSTSTTTSDGIYITLNELNANSDQFIGSVILSDHTDAGLNKILANPGDEVIFTYTDSHSDSVNTFITVNDDPQPGDLTITVLDPYDNAVQNARVEIFYDQYSNFSNQTNGSGVATFDPNIGGEDQVKVIVYPPDGSPYALAMQTIQVENGVYTGEPITITLTEPLILIKVKNPDESEFNNGHIELFRIDDQNYNRILNDNIKLDTYNLPYLDDGNYMVMINPHFDSVFAAINPLYFSVEEDIVEINGVVQSDPIMVTCNYVQIRGLVNKPTEPADSAYNFDIMVFNQSGIPVNAHYSNGGGKYKVSGLPVGQYSIKIMSREEGLTDSIPVQFNVTEITQTINLNILLTTPQVSGVVKDPDGSVHTQGGCIQFYDINHQYIYNPNLPGLNSNGSFSFGGLADGTYYIKARPEPWSGFTSSDFVEIIIEGGVCTNVTAPIELRLKEKTLQIIEIPWKVKVDRQIEVRIENFSLLDLNDLSVTINVNGQLIEFTNTDTNKDIWGDHYDNQQDIGRLIIYLPEEQQLPYGKYELTVKNGEDTIPVMDGVSDYLFIVAIAEITPRVIVPDDYSDGPEIVVEVRPVMGQNEYPWDIDDEIRARIINKVDGQEFFFETEATIKPDKTLSVIIPDDLNESLCSEGDRHVEFYDVDNGTPLAWGGFSVGVTIVNEMFCLEKDSVQLLGQYLNGYVSNNTYAELKVDDVILARSNGWSISNYDIQLNFNYELLALPEGKEYSIDLYVNGNYINNLPNDKQLIFIPRLYSDNPIINGNMGDTITVNEEGSSGWSVGENLTVIVSQDWAYEITSQNSSDGVIVNEDKISLTTKIPLVRGSYYVQIKSEDGTTLGYSILYASEGQEILEGTVLDPESAATTSGFVELRKKDGYWKEKFAVERNGKFYIPGNNVLGGPGNYTITAYPSSGSNYCISQPLEIYIDGMGNFSQNNVSLVLQEPMGLVTVKDPVNNPVLSGYIDILRDNGEFYEYFSHYDFNSTLRIPPLEDGSYGIRAGSPDSDYVSSEEIRFTVNNNEIYVDGVKTDEFVLILREIQVIGSVTEPGGSVPVEQKYFDVCIYADNQFDNIGNIEIRYSNGQYKVGGLKPGEYKIRIVSRDFEGSEYTSSFLQEFTIPSEGQEGPVILDVEMTVLQLTGTVKDSEGNTVQRGSISVLDQNKKWYPYDRVQIIDGSFKLGGLEDGTYYLNVFLPYDVGAGYGEYNTFYYYKIVISDGQCVEPESGPIIIEVPEKQTIIEWVDDTEPGAESFTVHFLNFSLLGIEDIEDIEDINNLINGLTFDIYDEDNNHYEIDHAELRFWDQWDDRAAIDICIKNQAPLQYGKYSLDIIKPGGEPIDALNDSFFLVAGAFTDPIVVTASEFIPGKTYTVDVNKKALGNVYPWSVSDTVHVRLKHDQSDLVIETTADVAENGILTFVLPGGTIALEGRYHIDFIKVVDDDVFKLAHSELFVGDTQVKKVTAKAGEGRITILGDYLKKYMQPDAYLEIYHDGNKIADAYNFNDAGGNIQYFAPIRFEAGIEYEVSLFVPGQGWVLENEPLVVLPYLQVNDPIIELGSDNTVIINGAQGTGWTSSDDIRVDLHGDWETTGFNVKTTAINENSVTFDIPASMEIEVAEGGTYSINDNAYIVDIYNDEGECLGYTILYATWIPDSIIRGSVKDVNGDSATGGIVQLKDRYWDNGWETLVGPDGYFYFSRNYIYPGEFVLVAHPLGSSNEAADFEFIKINDVGYEGSFDLQYNEPQIIGRLILPDGETAATTGFINISDDKYLYAVPVSLDGTFRIGGLKPGKYYIDGSSNGDASIMNSYGEEVNLISEDALIDVGVLKLRNPQLTVTATAGGQPVDFDVQIRPVDPNQKDFYESRRDMGVIYIDKLEPGTYYVTALTWQVPYAPSEPYMITIDQDGVCSESTLELVLTAPKLTGEVKTPEGDTFLEGNVEVFGIQGIGGKLNHIMTLPINDDGNFYMGGLPDGQYYLRACLHDWSPYNEDYSASVFTAVELYQGATCTLILNDRTPRYKNVKDATYSSDRLYLRLLNVSQIEDINNSLRAEILKSNGDPLEEPIIISNFNIRWETHDHRIDEADVELFIDGGLRLPIGEYSIQLKYNDEILACDDNDRFNLRYEVFANPGAIDPAQAEGAAILFDINKDWEAPYPWEQGDTIHIDFYGSDSLQLSASGSVEPDGRIRTILPEMPEDWYKTELWVNDQFVAFGGFTVGVPIVESIDTMLQGDNGVNIRGRNLSIFKDFGTFKAQILDEENNVQYESNWAEPNWDSLYIDFKDNSLLPGKYTLRIEFNGEDQPLPNDGEFKVIHKLDADPPYVLTGYENKTITISTRPGSGTAWEAHDPIQVVLHDNEPHNIEPVDVNTDSVTFELPEGLPIGGYWVSVIRNNGQNDWEEIAASGIDVADEIQIEGVVRNQKDNQPVPYAEVDINNDSFGFHKEADRDGKYFVYRLPQGTYRLKATAPAGQKLITPDGEEFVDIIGEKITRDLYLQPASLFTGTISLPEGEVAPEGGYHIGVGAWSFGSDGQEGGDDDTGHTFTEVIIPAGENSIEYKLLVNSMLDNYIIGLWLQQDDKYISEYFYRDNGSAFSKAEATLVDGDTDLEDLDFSIVEGHTISGTISLPDGTVAPEKGIKLKIVAVMPNGNDIGMDDYVGTRDIHIPQGQSSMEFTLPVPPNAPGQGYIVFYELEQDHAFIRQGFYTTDSTTSWKHDRVAQLDLSSENQTNINLTLLKPQLSVRVKDPNGDYTDAFGIDIQPIDVEYFNFDRSHSDGVEYIWGLEPGEYYVYGVPHNDPFAPSDGVMISIGPDGVCDPATLTLSLKEPRLTGQVLTHTGETFTEGWVEVFTGSENNLRFMYSVPLNEEGKFYLGGSDGTQYYVRARIFNDSPLNVTESASKYTLATLPEELVSVYLCDKSPRFRGVWDAETKQDIIVVRLINASSVEDINDLTAEILNSDDLTVKIITNIIVEPQSYYEEMDEISLILILDNGFILFPDEYRLVIKNKGLPLPCDDTDNGKFNLYYTTYSYPLVIIPGNTTGTTVSLDIQCNDPGPLAEGADIEVDLYKDGIKLNESSLTFDVQSDKMLTVTLPDIELDEGEYEILISVDHSALAIAGLAVGNPEVKEIFDIAEGNRGITLQGKYLEFFDGNDDVYARICKLDGTVLYTYEHIFSYGDMYIEFNCHDLKPGEYKLELGYGNTAIELPNGGKFRVVDRVLATPSYVLSDYGDSTKVTLKPAPGAESPWNQGDTLEIRLFGMYQKYIVEDSVITNNGDGTISFFLPVGENKLQADIFNIDVIRIDENSIRWIATCQFGIADHIQVSGKVTDAETALPVPYAWVDIYNDNNGYRFYADENGNYNIYGLEPGDYRIRAEAPAGTKYVSTNEDDITVAADSLVEKDLTLQSVNYFTGTISLPEGHVAPPKGYEIGIATISLSDEYATYFTKVIIPEDSDSVEYKLPVKPGLNDYVLKAWINDNSKYIGESIYNSTGTVYSEVDASKLDSSSDRNGLNITLSEGITITGTVSLPEDLTAPEGGMELVIRAIMDNGTETKADDYAGSVIVIIPEGESEAAYTIALPENPEERGYWLGYLLYGDHDLEREGYYTADGTVYNRKLSDSIDLRTGNKTADLFIAEPQAPVIITANIFEDGQHVEINMSKPMDENTMPANGFTMSVNGSEYALAYEELHGDAILFSIQYMVFPYDENIMISYDGTGGFKSDDGILLEAVSDFAKVDNKSDRSVSMTGIYDGGIVNDNVILTVEISGLNLSLYVNDEFRTSNDNVIIYEFEGEGTFTASVESDKLKDAIELTFTIDKTKPVVSISGYDETPYNTDVTPVIVYSDNLATQGYLTNNETVTLTRDGVVVGYTPGNVISGNGSYILTVSTTDEAGNESLPVSASFTIDTVAPVIGISAVANNGLYNRAVKPMISFTDNYDTKEQLAANATIKLNGADYESGTEISENGTYTLVITTVDAAGNEAQKQVSFEIDTIKPVITIGGYSNIENDPAGITPTITFVSSDIAANTRMATLNGVNYNFESPTTIKAPGVYTLVVSAKDMAGNLGFATATFEIKWDMSAPVISVTGITNGGFYETATPVISLEGGSNLSNYKYTAKLFKNGELVGTYSNILPVVQQNDEGLYRLEITATNPSYTDISSSRILEFTVDKQNPTSNITGVTNNATYNTPVNPQIVFTDNLASQTRLWNNAIITLTKDGTAVTSYKPGDVIAADGTYVLTARTKDALDHESNETTVSFVIDTTKPVIAVSGAIDGNTYKDREVEVTATTNEGTLVVKVNNQVVTLTDNKLTLTGEAGRIAQYVVTLTATDSAGNVATRELKFTIDRLPINIIVNGIVEGQIVNFNPSITYTAYHGTTELQGTIVTMDNAPYNATTVLTEGTHTFEAKVVYEGVTHTKQVSFIVDKTAPAISNISLTRNGTAMNQAVYTKAGDILGIKAKVNDANGVKDVYASLGDQATGIRLQYNQSSGFYEGTYAVGGGDYSNIPLRISAVDKAGNTGNNQTYPNAINIDNTKPQVTRTTIPSSPDGKNNIYVAPGMSVVLTAGANETIMYIINGTLGSALGSKTLTPAQGDNIISYRAYDEAGNMGDEKIFAFKYDSVRPANVTITPAAPLTNTVNIKVTGTVQGEGTGTKVILMRGNDTVATTDVRADSSFEFSSVRLFEGQNSFQLTAVDYAGNTSANASTLVMMLDSFKPLLRIEKDEDGEGQVYYSVTTNESVNGLSIRAEFNGAPVSTDSINVVSTTEFKIKSPEEIEGLNTLNVWVTDLAGNTGTGSYSSTYIPANTEQNGLGVSENTIIDIPAGAFVNEIQMVVKTVSIDNEIEYKPITAPVSFDFTEEPSEPIVVRIQIGIGLKGVMLMHIDDNGEAGAPVVATVTLSEDFDLGAIGEDEPYYLSDTGELVFKTKNFSAYGPVIDNTPPVITIITSDFTINKSEFDTNNGITLAGTIADVSDATIISVEINGVAMDLSGVAAGLLDKTFSIPLEIDDDGEYEVVIQTEDSAGNTSDLKTVTFNVDINNPTITATSSTALTNRNTAELSIDVDELSVIKVNGELITEDQGVFTITVDLHEGTNTLNVTATDAFGNISNVSTVTITRDTQPPEISVSGVSDGDVYGAGRSITVSVAEAATQTVTLDGEAFVNGLYSTEGHHILAVTAVDEAGNIASAEIEFTIDTSVPSITVTGADNNGLYTADKALEISVANAEEMTITKSVNGGAPQNIAVPEGELEYTLPVTVSNNQQQTIEIRIRATREVDGQIRTADTTLTFTIDKKAPVLTVLAAARTENASINITGSVDELSDIYLGNELITSNQQAGNFTISGLALSLGVNTFTVKAIDKAGYETTRTVTIERAEPQTPGGNNGGGNSGGGVPGGSVLPVIPPVTEDETTITLVPEVQNGVASSSLKAEDVNKAFEGAEADENGIKSIKIYVEKAKDANTYVQEIPASLLKTGTNTQRYIINTDIATIELPGNMFRLGDVAGKTTIGISVGLADTSKLTDELKEQIVNRPVIELTALADGKPVEWNNPRVPVTITMDYKPTAEELKNPDHIVVVYIDGQGNVIEVPTGKFDPKTNKITFTTTHFSTYAVLYQTKTFKDLGGAYGKSYIEALASKGFYNWITEDEFGFNRNITRGEFIYLLMTALDLHAGYATTFNDVDPTDFYYDAVVTAGTLGVTYGIGNNLFGAKKEITRQDMSTLVVNALKVAGKNYTPGKAADLNIFKDADKVPGYAAESLATLVKAEVLVGYNGILDPGGTFTRQQAAIVIYKVFNK